MEKLLIIDDDVELCELISEFIDHEEFSIQMVHDGQTGYERALAGDYSLVILDVMLPRMNGLDVLKKLRMKSAIPVLLLTARGEEVDRIIGLEVGADDYLPKPFNARELVARIRAILRRTSAQAKPDAKAAPERITVGDIELDTGTRGVWREGKPIELTAVEFNLLEALLREAGRVVAREDLVQAVLGRAFSPYDRSIDMHVSKLRKKLGDQQKGRDYIKTVRSVGYIYSFPGTPKRLA
jgi:two-component system response regulator CpxR